MAAVRSAIHLSPLSRFPEPPLAAADLATKAAAYTELSTLARSGGVSVTTSVNGAAGTDLDRANTGDVGAVATAVTEIVSGNFRDNTEVMLFCMRLLKGQSLDKLDAVQRASLQATCVKFLDDSVNAAGLRLAVDYGVLKAAIAAKSMDSFSQFWTSGRASSFADASQRKSFADRLRAKLANAEQSIADCFDAATNETDARACFFRLRSPTQVWAIAN